MDHKKAYIRYMIKDAKYSARFEATNDIEAKLMTRRIHGDDCEFIRLYRFCGKDKLGRDKIKGIQL